jgi:hypothetical protein
MNAVTIPNTFRSNRAARRRTTALRIGAIGLLAAGFLVGVARPVAAAAPSNDTIAGATVITQLPFTDTVDTTEAETDSQEEEAAQPCVDIGAPAIEKAVWYTGTIVSSSLTVGVDVTASSYSAGIAVFDGPPSAETFVTCGPGMVAGPVSSGQTFYLMVFGDMPESPGGTLAISVFETVMPDVALTVDPIGHFEAPSGAATVSGSASCSGADFASVSGRVRQEVGRFVVSGFFFTGIPCDGVTHTWIAEVIPQSQSGEFRGGKASVDASAFACGLSGCDQAVVQQPIRLAR